MADSEVIEVYMPTPGELGIGTGRLYSDGEFHSIIWFPYSAREDAVQMVEESDGRWVLREEVPF